MASLRAHLYDWMIRFGVRARFGNTPDVAKVREVLDRAAFPDPPGVAFTPGRVGGIPGEWVEAEAGTGRLRLLYLHGGGFIACSPRTHRPITGFLARRGFRIFAPDYRLAPEHPFPAALEDALAAWRSFSEGGPAAVAGDSAGGNLALGLMVEARREGLPLPMAAALFSPATDLLGRGASFIENARREAMFDGAALERIVAAYMGGRDPRDPRASPLEADLAGLPPLLIHVGAREMLRDDSVRLAERARAQGVRVDLAVWPVVPHAWQLANSFLPEARRSLHRAADFLGRELEPRVRTVGEPVP